MKDRIDVTACLARSWTLYKSQFVLIFFTTLVVTVAASAASAIPYVGPVIGLLFNGVLYGRLWSFYLKLIRQQKAEVADAFDGFRNTLVPLILASVATQLLIVGAVLAAALPMIFTIAPRVVQLAQDLERNPDPLLAAIGIGTVINMIVCVLIALFLYVIWIFTVPLVIDKRMDFGFAMQTSRRAVMNNFSAMVALLLAGILLTLLGVLAVCVGVFLTLPIFFGAISYAYEDLFGSLPSAEEHSTERS